MTRKEAEKIYKNNEWILRNMNLYKNCVIPNEIMEGEKRDAFIQALEVLTGRAIKIDTVYSVDYTVSQRMIVQKDSPTYIAEFD